MLDLWNHPLARIFQHAPVITGCKAEIIEKKPKEISGSMIGSSIAQLRL